MAYVNLAALAISAYAGNENAKNNNEIAENNYGASIEAQSDTNTQLNEQTRQQEEITADQELEARIKALQAQSTLQASGRGVSGVSVDRQSQAIQNSLGKYLQDSTSNTESSRRQLSMSKKGVTAQTQSRINSTPRAAYDPTADIVNTGLSIYTGFDSAKRSAAKNDMEQPSFTDYTTGDWK
tara:strand:+ start:26072 stop:26617 length:546 start_codon:yes stop_codon:yes gene_type:complete